MPGPDPDDAGEVPGAVAGTVVGDDAVDVGDAVRGEPHLGPGQERGGGLALLISERLGVGESGEPVDDGVQVDIAASRAGGLGAVGGLGLVGVAAVDPPSAAVGDPADLLRGPGGPCARASGR